MSAAIQDASLQHWNNHTYNMAYNVYCGSRRGAEAEGTTGRFKAGSIHVANAWLAIA